MVRFLLFFSLCTIFCACKSSNYIDKENEVLFVYFEKDEKHQKSFHKYGKPNDPITRYHFIPHDVIKYPQLGETLMFSFRTYMDLDQKAINNPVPVFQINKKFLKKNKDIIITLEDIQKMGYEKALSVFRKAKHIFLIDSSEIKNNKLTIKEVFLLYLGEE